MYTLAFNVLEILKTAKAPVTSGEISSRLSISKAAVWKHVNELRVIGYDIAANDEEGYSITEDTGDYHPYIIYKHMKSSIIGSQMRFFNSIPSTTWFAKDLAEQGDVKNLHGMVVVAKEQTGGVGRMGRTWVSPDGGIWVTIILHPDIPLDHLFMLTVAGADAVARVIHKMYDIGALIKWPNDIIIGDKKVGGILLEAGTEGSKVNYCLVGIGVDANINLDDLSGAFNSTITSISSEIGHDVDRAALLAAILKAFENRYDMITKGEYNTILREWKSFSSTIGRRVRITTPRSNFEGEAIDIDNYGALIVKRDNGKIEKVIAGDCTHL